MRPQLAINWEGPAVRLLRQWRAAQTEREIGAARSQTDRLLAELARTLARPTMGRPLRVVRREQLLQIAQLTRAGKDVVEIARAVGVHADLVRFHLRPSKTMVFVCSAEGVEAVA